MKVVLTGSKRSGKSTIVRKIVDSFGGRIAGFRTLRGNTLCTMVDLRTGKEAVIARGSSEHWTSEPAGFLEVGVPSLERSMEDSDLVVMDELGTFEDTASDFQAAVLRVLDSGRRVLAVTRDRSTPFLEAVRSHPKVRVRSVSRRTGDRTVKEIQEWLTER